MNGESHLVDAVESGLVDSSLDRGDDSLEERGLDSLEERGLDSLDEWGLDGLDQGGGLSEGRGVDLGHLGDGSGDGSVAVDQRSVEAIVGVD